jgi:high affinity sulfate transporter 1
MTTSRARELVARWVPAAAWLPRYRPEWLRADLVAGITLAAYLVPAGIGDASLANLPPEAGLYACLFSGLVFWLLCSSTHTAITVTSAISLLVGASLGELSGGDPVRHAALAACTAIMVAALAFAAWALRAGAVVSFVSETVLTGFKAGVALHLASTQLPKLLGFSGTHGNFWERVGHLVRHAGETNVWALLIGGTALAIILLGKRLLPGRPVALVVVVGGIAVASLTDLETYGVRMLGTVPQGLPALGLPAVRAEDINHLLPLAMACFLLAAVETTAIGRMFAQKHRSRLDPDQEFLGLAGANLLAGIGAGFPVSGGMSQSLVNESGGARTPASGLIAALLLLMVTLFLSGLLRHLPQPVLAAIVLAAVTGLLKLDALRRVWRFSRAEFAVAIVALLGVLGSGLLRGVLIGAVLSLLLLLRRASRPNVTELGRVPGTGYFADLRRHPENEQLPDVAVLRCEASLLYFNAENVRDRLCELAAARGPAVRLVVLYLGMVPMVDLAGAEMLAELHHTFEDRGIALRLAEARGEVREALARSGFEAVYGPVEAHQTVDTVVRAWQAQREPR